MAKPKQKVKRTTTHDRLALTATFENGDEFKASITRTGERFTLAQFPETPKVTTEEVGKIKKLFARQEGELNGARFDRIAAACEAATSLSELAKNV